MSREDFGVTGWLAWGAYLLTTTYGHVALKLAAGSDGRFDVARSVSAFASWWGISAFLAWAVSAWAWMLVLTRHSLLEAGGVSGVRFILMAAAAWCWLGERWEWRDGAGIVCVATGAWLLKR